jgi:regulator of protease activity HflC (stomatin/prohibitin superfamily)
MELQMKAERERRAVILTAEGEKQSQILTAEGARQAAILNAEGAAKAIVIKAEAEAEAVQRVFDAVRSADLDDKMLAYQYLEQLPVIANGTASKLWLLPSELSGAIEKIAGAFRPGK